MPTRRERESALTIERQRLDAWLDWNDAAARVVPGALKVLAQALIQAGVARDEEAANGRDGWRFHLYVLLDDGSLWNTYAARGWNGKPHAFKTYTGRAPTNAPNSRLNPKRAQTKTKFGYGQDMHLLKMEWAAVVREIERLVHMHGLRWPVDCPLDAFRARPDLEALVPEPPPSSPQAPTPF